MAAPAQLAPDDERTPLDDLEDLQEQVEQWESNLKNQPGEPSARVEIRNWLLPIFRKLFGVIDGVATDLVEEMDERMDVLSVRVDEVSGLARAVAGTAGISELLAQVHVLCQRILAADLGEETQEMAESIRDFTVGHYNAVMGARAQAAEAAPAVPVVVTAPAAPVVVTVPSAAPAASQASLAPGGDVIPPGAFDATAAVSSAAP